MEKVKLRITTITPVTIGSGKELSPYADYIAEKDKIYFIDTKKSIDKIMAKGDKFLEDYISGIANGMDNNRSLFDLKNFLFGNRIVQSIEEVSSIKCSFVGDSKFKHPIKGMIQSPLGEPYIPGSTIKGALKTILMYNWLKNNKQGNKIIEDVLTKKDNRGRPLNFDSLEKKFETFVDRENRLIRKNTIQQVTDSTFLKPESKVVVDCYRKMPIRLECIPKGETAEFELVLDKFKWEELAMQINEYVKDSINREFEIIKEQDDLIAYYNNLVDIEEEVTKAKSNVAYLRLGFGKGYYLNSLGIAIYDYVMQDGKEELRDKYEKFINTNFARKNKYGIIQEIELEEFPKTRLYVSNTQEPLGWVKIEKVNYL